MLRKFAAVGAALAITASMMGVTAMAVTYTADPETFTTTISGTYILAGARAGWTTTKPNTNGSNHGYNSNLKKSVYKEYEYDGGFYEVIYSDTKSSTNISVSTTYHEVDPCTSERYHGCYLYHAANASSGVDENRLIFVYRPQP